MESRVRELLVEELKDISSAQRARHCSTVEKALQMTSAPALRGAYRTAHPDRLRRRSSGVETAMEKLPTRPGRKVCEAMRGLVEEATALRSADRTARGPYWIWSSSPACRGWSVTRLLPTGLISPWPKLSGEQEVVDLLTATFSRKRSRPPTSSWTEVTAQGDHPLAAMEEGVEEEFLRS